MEQTIPMGHYPLNHFDGKVFRSQKSVFAGLYHIRAQRYEQTDPTHPEIAHFLFLLL